ncbi:MAG: DnaD domain protein [Clostridiales bacterium]|jgi:DnaD/phage-associated family protein|nr:DnaD domain protein [Clostridiales bacterium]
MTRNEGMGAEIILRANQELLGTYIPNAFIDGVMPKLAPAASVIYVYAASCAQRGFRCGLTEIVKKFGFSPAEAERALVALKKEGFLDFYNDGADEGAAALSAMPSYTSEEIGHYAENSPVVREILKYAESRLGKVLRYTDMKLLVGLLDWLRMEPPLVRRLIDYCAEQGRDNVNYIETVAVDWSKRGIKTAAQADEYIDTFDKTYRAIFKAIGRSGPFAPAEIEYMEKWTKLLPLEIILEACDKTVINCGRPSFAYADKVIETWGRAGVASREDIARLEESFSADKLLKPEKTRKKSKFANFTERKVDYEKIYEEEWEKLSALTKEG